MLELLPTQIRHTVPLFIDGAFRTHTETFPHVDPRTGGPDAAIVRATAADVDEAVDAAQRALRGPWGRTSVAERASLLHRVADGIDRRAAEFIAAEIADTGKPYRFASSVDVPRGAANFRAFADLACAFPDEQFESKTPRGTPVRHQVYRRPLGVVGVICPWNLPLLLLTWKVAPALAMGNTVVAKPSELTPRTATLLAEVMHEAGVPSGVYNVVHGHGAGEAGQWLVKHPGVAAITFTGESATGSAIQRDAAASLKRLSFELGGKNAAVVFADANLDDTLAGLTRSVFANNGQVCLCTERVLVHRSRFDEISERLARVADNLPIADPFLLETEMGPLVSQVQRQKVQTAVDGARLRGAEALAGNRQATPDDRRFAGGWWFPPTVLAGLSDHDDFVRNEVFGPVCHLTAFDDEDEALARANDSDYGLCASVWTRDPALALRAAQHLDVGTVWVNDWFVRDLRAPFGGTRRSGIGREGGRWSLEFFAEICNICTPVPA